MSSPISSLKKSTKSPLPKLTHTSSLHGYDSRNIPSLKPLYSDGESKLLDEVTTNMASSRQKSFKVDPIHGGLSSGGVVPLMQSDIHENMRKHTPNSTVNPSAPSNHELMSIMMARVSQLEQKVKYQTKEICEKDKKLKILEDKLKILQSSRGNNDDDDSFSKTAELEKKCLLLQQQLYEMEHFLSDYGMVWVGEEAHADSKTYHRRLSEETSDAGTDSDRSNSVIGEQGVEVWKPASSTKAEFKVDYNLILQNIKELNILAGEGISQVQRTTDGARLKVADSIPLALYANGIALYSGPFRSFADVETQQFIQDLMDGYFPTELQARSPNGIPLQVSDKRDVFFRDPRHTKAFTGAGQLLGGELGPSRLVSTNLPNEMIGTFQSQLTNDRPSATPSSLWNNNEKELKEETQLPGHKLSAEQFLNKLPKSVMKHGQIIDIRSSLEQTIRNGDSDGHDDNGVDVLDTDVVQELMQRLEVDEEERPPTPRDITTLRIRSDKGTKTFVVKMKFDDTIADLRRHIDKKRSRSALPYEIVSPFPRQIFKDKSATLRTCGLIPNAALLLRVKKA